MPYSFDRRSETLDFWLNRIGLDWKTLITHIKYFGNMYDNRWKRRPEYTNLFITKEMITDIYKEYTLTYIRGRNCKGCFMCNPKLSEEKLKNEPICQKCKKSICAGYLFGDLCVYVDEEEEEGEEEMYECPKCGGEENIPLCKTHNICSSCWFNAIDILIKYRQNKKKLI